VGSYRQIYQCDIPPNCAAPLEAAETFFAGNRVRHLKRGATGLEFESGAKWKAWAAIWPERSVHRQVAITVVSRAERPALQCEYRAFYPYPTAHFAPWHFEREVADLENFLAHWQNLRAADPTVSPLAAVAEAEESRQRESLYRRSLGSRFNPGIYLLYRLYRLATWLTHVTRRRFTILGRALLGAVCVAITTAFDVDGASGYQAVVPIAGVLFIAVVCGFRFRSAFEVERKLARVASVGQPFRYRVNVTNRTRKPQAGLTLMEDLADPRPPYREWRDFKLDQDRHVRPFRFERRQLRSPFKFATPPETQLPPLLPGERREVTLELTPLRRGVMRFEGVTIARPDPLGIFRALRRIRLPQSVLVLPARYVIPPIALPGQMRYQPGGVAMASHIGQSEEFVSLRDYRRGDPPRHIHWRSWAKVGKPIVKEFEDEFFVRHALVLDTFTPRPFSDTFEAAVAVAASFACTVLTQESLLDLLFVGAEAYSFTAGRGLAHADQMLEILAAVQPCRTLPFQSLEALVLNHAKSVGGCICVLLAWDEPRQRFVRKLRAVGQPVMVLVIRGPGETRPLPPGPMSDAPEWFHTLEIGRIEAQLAALK
jgi:uncharacterized protein (DUF58 family)